MKVTAKSGIYGWERRGHQDFLAVLWIRDILVRIRISESAPLTYGSGSGSSSFSTKAFKMPTKNKLRKFFANYFLKVHVRQSSEIKS
jgi:hypothetical protein